MKHLSVVIINIVFSTVVVNIIYIVKIFKNYKE